MGNEVSSMCSCYDHDKELNNTESGAFKKHPVERFNGFHGRVRSDASQYGNNAYFTPSNVNSHSPSQRSLVGNQNGYGISPNGYGMSPNAGS